MSDDARVAEAREAAEAAAGFARRAGELLLGYFRRENLVSSLKNDYSVVTEADVAADRLLAGLLRERFPDDAILSEELRPDWISGSRSTWIVDPLDGTTNFSLGVEHWGVSIGRCRDGVPDVGVLAFPALGELYVSSRGGGATLNGATIRTRVPSSSHPIGMLACCSRTPRFHHVNLPLKMRVYGAAAYTLACVARGSAAVGMETRPKVWDLAAGWCLVEEAGGVIATMDGSRPFPLSSDTDYASASFPVLAAASADLAAQANEHIERR
jgi:myo-inositol-1(or 4)-monophosphatase